MFKIHTITNEVYFTDQYSFVTEGKKLDGTGVTLIECVPKNGRDKGKTHKFPLHHVTCIVEGA